VKQVAFKVLILLVSILLALILGEQLLRLIGYQYRPVSIDVGNTEDARYYHLFGSDHFVYDPDLIWKPRPGRDVFNAEGFRGPLMGSSKSPERLRIVTIGDSNTLGWAGPDGPNWPQSLGRLLAAREIDADVVNGGVWGYSSLQGLARLRQVLAFEPDMVLVSFGSNDAVQVAIRDRRFAGKSERRRELERWFNHYRLGQLTSAVVNASHRGGASLVPRVSLAEYRENLRQMIDLAATHGVQLVLLTRPFELQIPDEVWWKNFGYDYNLATAELAFEAGLPLVDFYSHFKGRREYFADESHFTAEGHEMAAQIVLAELGPLLRRGKKPPGKVSKKARRRGATNQ
jgi:lysophospholipase L1-like esterase